MENNQNDNQNTPDSDTIKDNIQITPENNNDNDKTFNRLKDLQTLLKKESALKELCKFLI